MTNGRLTPPVRASDHQVGGEDALVTLVEYGDFECSSCGSAHPVVQSIQRKMGDSLRFVFRHFPRNQAHAHAQHAAEAAEAAGAQGKFWEMHDVLLEHQRANTPRDVETSVRRRVWCALRRVRSLHIASIGPTPTY